MGECIIKIGYVRNCLVFRQCVSSGKNPKVIACVVREESWCQITSWHDIFTSRSWDPRVNSTCAKHKQTPAPSTH